MMFLTSYQIRWRRVTALMGVFILIGAGWLFTQPVGQPLIYHQFADSRPLMMLANGANVLSNLPFVLVGLLGLFWLRGDQLNPLIIKVIYAVFFAGLILTGIGSGYYHLMPDNETLISDRLAMTVCFTGLVALIVAERIDLRMGAVALPFLMVTGIFTVVYWGWVDDLRPYILFQYGAMLLLPVIILRTQGPGTQWLWLSLLFYVVAKLTEMTDEHVYLLTEQFISGHSLKHLAASFSGLMIALKLRYS